MVIAHVVPYPNTGNAYAVQYVLNAVSISMVSLENSRRDCHSTCRFRCHWCCFYFANVLSTLFIYVFAHWTKKKCYQKSVFPIEMNGNGMIDIHHKWWSSRNAAFCSWWCALCRPAFIRLSLYQATAQPQALPVLLWEKPWNYWALYLLFPKWTQRRLKMSSSLNAFTAIGTFCNVAKRMQRRNDRL